MQENDDHKIRRQVSDDKQLSETIKKRKNIKQLK